jgi:hypothetical protein
VSQLLEQDTRSDILRTEVFKMFDNHQAKPSYYPALEELEAIFSRSAGTFSKIFIVIDALDEIPNRSGIAGFLTGLSLWSGDVKVLVASRRENDLEEAFAFFGKLTIDSINIRTDIERYVKSRISRFRWHDVPDLGDIVQELVRRADGM